MTTGMPARDGFLDRPDERPGVERRQHDAADALAQEALDDLDLLLAIVLAERALPDHVDVDALRLQLALGLDRAGVDGAPELVGRALGDDRDLIARLVRARGARRRPRRVSTTRRRRTRRSARRGRDSRPARFGIGARREGIPPTLRAARPQRFPESSPLGDGRPRDVGQPPPWRAARGSEVTVFLRRSDVRPALLVATLGSGVVVHAAAARPLPTRSNTRSRCR